MLLTTKRLSRYLSLQKKVNDYLLKLYSKDRNALIKLSEIKSKSLQAEEGLRNLLEHLAEMGVK